MDEQLILAAYERIARLTGQMLAAAQASQWERLTTLEHECSALFAPLVENDRSAPGGVEYRRRKAALIRGILDDDARIRLLVEPQLAHLSALLGSARRQQRLAQAYQPPA